MGNPGFVPANWWKQDNSFMLNVVGESVQSRSCDGQGTNLARFVKASLLASVSLAALAVSLPVTAVAQCSTSSNGLTRTCTADVTTPQSFNHSGLSSGPTYSFVFENLTSSSITASSGDAIEFITTANNGSSVFGAGVNFSFDGPDNDDLFPISSDNDRGIEVRTTAGSGRTPSENSGSDDITGFGGGRGRAGGDTVITLTNAHVTGSLAAVVAASTGGVGGTGGEGRSTEFGDGFGGGGGFGGAGGEVQASFSNVSLENAGTSAAALFLLSQGAAAGGGGTGKAAGYTGRGGTGGIGGAGGPVSFSFSDSLTVSNKNTEAIYLESAAGPGGSGGQGDNTVGQGNGGSGGIGGQGGDVTLTSTDASALTVTSPNGQLILLQSTGGNGGAGGRGSTGANGTNAGNGASGGGAGRINFLMGENSISLTNTGNSNNGLTAVSRGGLGGTGGSRGTSLGSGGSGGAGGDASLIDIQLNTSSSAEAKITAPGTGIIATSIGGTGGAGSSGGPLFDGGVGGVGGTSGEIFIGLEGSATIKGQSGISLTSQGGAGGKGGNGGNRGSDGGQGGNSGAVRFDWNGSDWTTGSWNITSTGDGDHGVFLQTLGGDGGDGGSGTDAESEPAGNGGDALGIRTGIYNNTRTIKTTGDNSFAFRARSAGGSGGNGGGTEGAGGPGDAGQAGDGGPLAIAGNWQITTSGADAYGLWFRSEGGRGGNGGRGNGTGIFTPAKKGAEGGDADYIDLLFGLGETSITASGSGSTAVYISSLGGHGGNAGSRGDGGTITGQGNVIDTIDGGAGGGAKDDIYLSTRSTTEIVGTAFGMHIEAAGGNGGEGNVDPTAGVAGNGGAGGTAGNIQFNVSESGTASTGSWAFETTQSGGTALFVQSVGGNGGVAGKALKVLAGSGGDGGAGGTITMRNGTQTASVTGSGGTGVDIVSRGGTGADGAQGSTGIAAGGGGQGGQGGAVRLNGLWMIDGSEASGTTGFLVGSFGGTGGDAGDEIMVGTSYSEGGIGGDAGTIVFNENTSAMITTTGVGAGFTSVGGAGGKGVLNQTTTSGAGNVGTDGGDGGRGGPVVVQGAWSITTTGDNAVALSASSIGGEGGPKGGPGASAGVGGTGAYVTIDLAGFDGDVANTSGAEAHGIYALVESASNADSATSSNTVIDVTVGGDIDVSGAASHGIYAESIGPAVGVIDVTVEDDARVSGGGESVSSAPNGAGVYVLGGTSNLLTNNGTITSTLGTGGTAVRYAQYNGAGSLDFVNNGITTGSVINAGAGASPITVVNSRSGIFNTGSAFEVKSLVNHGILRPGGRGNRGNTHVTGDFEQTSSGVISIDIDAAENGRADRLSIDGAASLDGRIEITLIDPATPLIGERRNRLITAQDGIATSGDFEVLPSIVAQYELLRANENRIDLRYDVDFANDTALAGLLDNQRNVAGHIDAIYEAAALDPDLASLALAAEDADSYAAIVNTLSAELAIDNQIGAIYSTGLFNEALFSCADVDTPTGSVRFLDDGQCAYTRIDGHGFSHDSKQDTTGFSGTAWSVSVGADFAVTETWVVGGALTYQRRNTRADQISATSDANQFFGGLVVKRRFGDFEVAAAQTVGYGDYDLMRNPAPGVQVTGEQGLWSTSGHLRAAYVFGSDTFFFKPRFTLGYDHVFSSSFTETGNTGLRQQVSTDAETYVVVRPALEFGGEVDMGSGIRLRPNGSVGFTQFLNSPEPSLTARFVDAPAAVPDFKTATKIDTTRLDLSGGIDLIGDRNFVLRAEGQTSLSRNSNLYGGSLKIEIPF